MSDLRTWRIFLTFIVLLASACVDAGQMAVDGGSEQNPLAELEQETGQKWQVRYHAEWNTPALLTGQTAPLAVTPEDATRAGRGFFLRFRRLFQQNNSKDDVAGDGAETDDEGMTHARFVQERDNVPVWNGKLIFHFDETGAIRQIQGQVVPLQEVGNSLVLTSDQARVAAVTDAISIVPSQTDEWVTRTPKKYLFPVKGQPTRLTWRVEVERKESDTPVTLEVFVDAQTGEIVQHDNRVVFAEVDAHNYAGELTKISVTEKSGRYSLEDPARGGQKTYDAKNKTKLPGSTITTTNAAHWDEAGSAAGVAVSTYAALATTYDYFLSRHRYVGWDNKKATARATVHFGSGFGNAFFNGRQIVFGDGNGSTLLPLGAALDVVAHEYTHAIVEETAHLDASGISGSINEAVADLFACFLTSRINKRSDWAVGETVYRPDGRFRPMRDLSAPHNTHNPAHLKEWVRTSDDGGGVHINSTIVSHAGYLMIEGKSGVRGLGIDAAERLWFRTLRYYLFSNSDYQDVADATLGAARDLHLPEAPIVAAWQTVGVVQ